MNLLFYLYRYPGFGGIETVTNMICPELAKHNVTIDILSHVQEPAPFVPMGIRKIYKMPDSTKFTTDSNIDYSLLISKGDGDNHYDAIIFQDNYAPIESIAVKMSRINGIPLYVFEHNSPLYIYNKLKMQTWLQSPKSFCRHLLSNVLIKKDIKRRKQLYDACEKYILLSHSYINEFSDYTNIKDDKQKIIAINNPVLPSDKKKFEKENIILYVGRLVKEKRVDLQIDIWRKISTILSNWEFIIVGDGPERLSLEQRAQGLERISFTGFQNPEKYYSKASLFLMTSSYEGFAMTLIEAMQHGVIPVALGTVSFIHDLIQNNENGLLLPENINTELISKSIINLASDGSKLNELSKYSIESVERFEIQNIIKNWLSLFR